jgi:hypothetical protein
MAWNPRTSPAMAQARGRALARRQREAEVRRLEKLASDLHYADPLLSQAYLEKAAEVKAQLASEPDIVPTRASVAEKVAMATADSVKAVFLDEKVTRMHGRLDALERSVAAERRPIGLPAPRANKTAGAGPIRPPRRDPLTWSREERAAALEKQANASGVSPALASELRAIAGKIRRGEEG